MDIDDCDEVYSESELTDNDSYSESDEETDKESDSINCIDECDEAPEDESMDKVLHDIDPMMFCQQFRTMCQRKIETWEKYREQNIFECTNTKGERKKHRESIIDKSKGTIQEENISTGSGSMALLKSNMKPLAIESATKNYGTPNSQIQNQLMDWQKSRVHKTKDVTKTPNAITEEINAKSMQQIGQKMRKYVKQDIAKSSDDDETQQFVTVNTNKAIKSNGRSGINGVTEEFFETVTTTTTTTTVKKIRNVSMLPQEGTSVNAPTFALDFSSDDSEPRLAGKKGKVKKRYNIESDDEWSVTPKKKEVPSAIYVPTPRRSMIIYKDTMKKEYLAKCSNTADIDTSHFRDIRVRRDEKLKIILPSTSSTPVKCSKMPAIVQTPHKEVNQKRDILSTIVYSPICKKPIIALEK